MELITRGEFWRFDEQEGATKTKQIPRKEEFWSFCDNIILNAHPRYPHEKVFIIGKSKHQNTLIQIKKNYKSSDPQIPFFLTAIWLSHGQL